MTADPLHIEHRVIQRGYDRKTCWVHARPGVIRGDTPGVIVTMQKLRISGSDVFYEINDLRSFDGGQTWSAPTAHAQTLGRRSIEGGIEEGVSDFTPMWHERAGVLLGTGHIIQYQDDRIKPAPRRRSTVFGVFDPRTGEWSRWREIDKPERTLVNEGAGCTQRIDLPNGDILLPTYVPLPGVSPVRNVATVMRCAFDGTTLRYLEHGTELTAPDGRGFVEPSIVHAEGKYLLSLRNDHANCVARGEDGLHFGEAKKWAFDDGSDLGGYNTQQHWVVLGGAAYLVYTRRGAGNDHIFRHRAPLFIGRVDVDRLCVIRETERVLIPERGAALGNFGVTPIDERAAWVVASEWMQPPPPDISDCRLCEQRGSDNSVFLVRVSV